MTHLDPVMSMTDHDRNEWLINDADQLGYIGSHVLDLTFGHGHFWNVCKPDELTTNDINPDKGTWHYDYTAPLPPEWMARFDTTVFDPDYRMNGTPDQGDYDERYGTDVKKRWQDRLHDICDGSYNAAKTVRPKGFLLVKCQSQVVSGKKVWQERLIEDTVKRRCELVDRLHLPINPRPQRSQKHSRSNYSTLLVFKRVDRFS